MSRAAVGDGRMGGNVGARKLPSDAIRRTRLPLGGYLPTGGTPRGLRCRPPLDAGVLRGAPPVDAINRPSGSYLTKLGARNNVAEPVVQDVLT
jgi:hypothetical protein